MPGLCLEKVAAAHSSPALSQLTVALHHYRVYVDIGVVVGRVGDLGNLIAHFTTPLGQRGHGATCSPICPVLLVRRAGMGWAELGLETLALRSRVRWRRSPSWRASSLWAPRLWTRPMFLNNRLRLRCRGLDASMIIIPLQTVIPRNWPGGGVLHGAMDHAWGFRAWQSGHRCSSGCVASPRRSGLDQ